MSRSQRAWLFIRAMWWAMPDACEIVEWIRIRWEVWITYELYEAHWVKSQNR
jgi:hypothetical protein